MSADNVINEIRDSLNGRPGQPIVFGVCKALADKSGKEPWVYRAVAIVLTLFWTLPAVAAYIIIGFALTRQLEGAIIDITALTSRGSGSAPSMHLQCANVIWYYQREYAIYFPNVARNDDGSFA